MDARSCKRAQSIGSEVVAEACAANMHTAPAGAAARRARGAGAGGAARNVIVKSAPGAPAAPPSPPSRAQLLPALLVAAGRPSAATWCGAFFGSLGDMDGWRHEARTEPR